MTRKHFEAIALTIKDMQVGEITRKKIALEFAGMCRLQNRNFNEARFLKACGI